MFSIIIPTFNNLEYLKLCLNSIKKNSSYNHQIILHINEGSDGTLKYAKDNEIEYTYSSENIGLCSAVNYASKNASTDFILYSHDDMYFCPGWDKCLEFEISNTNNNLYYFSATMIEQKSGHIPFDCGNNYKNFNENNLLNNLNNLQLYDYQGSHWAPHLIHKETWNKIGGFSEEFNPGIGSDPDLNMKLWNLGVRIFKGLNNFKVYHFGSVSLRKKKNLIINKGSKTFLKKWGFVPTFFVKHYLRGGKFMNNKILSSRYDGPLKPPTKNFSYYIDLLFSKIKYLKLILFKT
tara:strand:+ start:781 stop:1656 length:876 start_codon:yes stop_codon:yes gene_type:complete